MAIAAVPSGAASRSTPSTSPTVVPLGSDAASALLPEAVLDDAGSLAGAAAGHREADRDDGQRKGRWDGHRRSPRPSP
jgi:hypothetical protein